MFRYSSPRAAFPLFASLFALGAIAAPAAPFRHPGIFNSEAELDFIMEKAGGTAPHAMKQGWERLRAWKGSGLDYANRPEATVTVVASAVGSSEQNFRDAGHAAYAHALQWVVTGDVRYRDKAMQILNGWSAVFKGMTNLSNRQQDLEAAWALPTWAAAAEIIRHHGPRPSAWAAADIARFETMLDILSEYAAYSITHNKTNNWGTSSALALMAVGVFEDDSAKFAMGLDFLVALLPKTVEKTGLLMETCRDCNHAEYNLLGVMAAAEIAWKQGIDFYGRVLDGQATPRLLMGMEFHASALLGKPLNVGQACGTQSCAGDDQHANGWEIGYNHYLRRAKAEAPATASFVTSRNRPDALSEDHFTGWTTLTHGDLGDIRDAGTAARPVRAGNATLGHGITLGFQSGKPFPAGLEFFATDGRRLPILRASGMIVEVR